MVFGRSTAGSYQTMNDTDEDDQQVSTSFRANRPLPAPSSDDDDEIVKPGSSSSTSGSSNNGAPAAAAAAAAGDVEQEQQQQQQQPPQQNWNTDTEGDDDEVLVEEEGSDDEETYEEEIVEDEDDYVTEDGTGSYFTTEEVDMDGSTRNAGGFPDAAPVLPGSPDEEQNGQETSLRSRDPDGTMLPRTYSTQKAPAAPEEPEQAPATGTAAAAFASASSSVSRGSISGRSTTSMEGGEPSRDRPQPQPPLRTPSIVNTQQASSKKEVEEAKEDQCLSSLQGLVAIGICIFLLLAAITIGTGLGVTKPWETEEVPTMAPTLTQFPTDVPTFAPVVVSPEDEELLALWESVVGDAVYEEGTPYYEAAQWMLYRDPSRVTRRRSYSRHLRRHLQDDVITEDEDLDWIQRYLMVFLWYATTNNGRQLWLSCNPIRPDYVVEDCRFQRAIRKLPSGEIQYEPIPWTRWLSGAEECDWAGVTCATTSTGRLAVSAIDLGGQGLVGPMEYIIEMMNLPELKTLAFAYNQLTGPLYPSLETLDILDLTDNLLEGPIIRLGGLSSLTLEGNRFTGTVPTELFQFTTPLRHLNLGGNLLIGDIPPEASFALQLTSLYLHDNRLEGTIPPELGQLPLASLRLQGNNFSGPVPVDTVNVNWLSTLEELWLFGNRLTGAIPPVLGAASRMVDLRLSQNSLAGDIPSDLYNLNRLFRLELAQNQLSGGLNIALASQLTNLEVLDLSGNELSGRILLDSRLANLQSLSLEFNQFTGNVPQSLCSISSLEDLSADCLPPTDPPNPCSCCTACCSRSTQVCADENGSPIQSPPSGPPASAPSSFGATDIQQWARDTFGDDIDQSNGSPHSLSSIWISEADGLGLTPEDATFLQRYVLALFYFSTRTWLSCNPASTTSCLYQEYVRNDDGTYVYVPTPATRWLAPVSECQWVGVLCSSGSVTGIDLLGQEINGQLITELVSLPQLATIQLEYNALTGTIPSVYGSISQLTRFEVQGNALTGSMPPEVCQIPFLESLIVDCNQVECSCCTTCCIDGECPI